MKIAVEGCAHGELDKIYEALEYLEQENSVKVDLLIICGDFQAVRNKSDLKCMAVPPKYQKLNTFYKYYSGEKKAPVLTIFIGGNHEASNYLAELPYGGWVCPNIFYLGYAGVIYFKGLKIAGLSGIYKGNDYLKGHFEIIPYDESTKRSAYHIRNVDVFRLKQIKQPIDIFISHDWPRGIYNYGNKEQLIRFKPFFKEEMENEKLGSRPAEELLHKLCPSYWFAAHLHCKFAAVVQHDKNGCKSVTKFLALDKCLPRRKFLQIVDVDNKNPRSSSLEYDPEWLCILRSTNHLLSVSKKQTFMPGPGCSQRWDFSISETELDEIKKLFKDDFKIPENFAQTALPYSPTETNNELKMYLNPQTTKLCETLGISDPLRLLKEGTDMSNSNEFSFVEELDVTNTSRTSLNPDEMSLGSGNSSDDIITENLDADSPFFIDKKGSSSSDQVQELSSSERLALHCKYLSPTTSASNVKYDFPEFKEKCDEELNSAENEPTSGETITKKFKRRNLSLYMSDEE